MDNCAQNTGKFTKNIIIEGILQEFSQKRVIKTDCVVFQSLLLINRVAKNYKQLLQTSQSQTTRLNL